jgi:probable rRNA maturation factor
VLSLVVDPSVRGRFGGARLDRLRRRVRRMVRAVGLSEGTGDELEVAVRLCDDPAIRELNRTYRDKDRPTDVLAFALREGEGGSLHPGVLGDIVISVETAARQARRGLDAELLFLAAHGLCHLIGYDHRDDAEEAEMNMRMAQLLAECARRGAVKPA